MASLLLACSPLVLSAQGNHFAAEYDVAWNSLGTNEHIGVRHHPSIQLS
jgi:hypothetical protein